MRHRLLAASWVLVLPFLCSAAAPPLAPAVDLTAAFSPNGDIAVTFHNTGNAPCTLNLGLSLGNGQSFRPTALSLLVAPPLGPPRELTFNGGPIGGRVDDFLVPLPAGSSYTIPLSPTDFISQTKGIPTTPQQPALPGESLQVRFTPLAASRSTLQPANLWATPLTSAAMQVPKGKP